MQPQFLISDLTIGNMDEKLLVGSVAISGEQTLPFNLVMSDTGECIMRIETSDASRFTLNGEGIDPIQFWSAFIEQKPAIVYKTKVGEVALRITIVGLNYTVEQLPTVPKFTSLTIEHRYNHKLFLPTQRKETKVKFDSCSIGQAFCGFSDAVRDNNITVTTEVGGSDQVLLFDYNAACRNQHHAINKMLVDILGPFEEL